MLFSWCDTPQPRKILETWRPENVESQHRIRGGDGMKTEQTHRHGNSKAGIRWGSLQLPQPISSASLLSSARREGLTCLWGAVLGCKHQEEGIQLLVFVHVDQSANI